MLIRSPVVAFHERICHEILRSMCGCWLVLSLIPTWQMSPAPAPSNEEQGLEGRRSALAALCAYSMQWEGKHQTYWWRSKLKPRPRDCFEAFWDLVAEVGTLPCSKYSVC